MDALSRNADGRDELDAVPEMNNIQVKMGIPLDTSLQPEENNVQGLQHTCKISVPSRLDSQQLQVLPLYGGCICSTKCGRHICVAQ